MPSTPPDDPRERPTGGLDPERFARLRRVVAEALPMAGDERTAFLDRSLESDASLRRLAESLLGREDFPHLLETGAAEELHEIALETLAAAAGRGPDEEIERIGPYRILGKLGEGGMGVVYLAEQPEPHRRVALKVIRGGRFVDDAQVRMFRREIETLARLKHPNIGAIYESGRTPEGRHYFAMELVQGPTLGEYLRERTSEEGPTPREVRHRLRLFHRIANAVHYAHQRGVIHRDLKPSNVVVVGDSLEGSGSHDGTPEVKILDFGLARITDADVQASLVSEVGVIKGTLSYMSPEQARGNPDEIDVRTDVYSLGVILYEMLTRELPKTLPSTSMPEALRVIIEDSPRPLRETFRGPRRLDPDVETICRKALENDPQERYQSALALADDVLRYLEDQPILARSPSRAYQLRKLVARHRLPFALAAGLFLLAVGSAVAMGILWSGQSRERERAEAEAERTERVNTFLQSMLESVAPEEARGEEVTVRYLVDQARERADEELAGDPEIHARIGQTLARTYRSLAAFEPAEEILREALETRRRIHGERSAEVVGVLNDLAYTRWEVGDLAAAEELYREALDILRSLGDEAMTATDLMNVGRLLMDLGRLDEAEASLRESLEIKRRLYGSEHPEIAEGLQNLGSAVMNRSLQEAEPILREAVEMQTRLRGSDHPWTNSARSDLAAVVRDLGRPEEALELLRQVVAGARATWGDRHPRTALALHNLGSALTTLGRHEEALEAFREGLAIRREALGDDHPHVAVSLTGIGGALQRSGNLTEAREVLEESLDLHERILGPTHPDALITALYLGRCLVALEDYRAAEPILARAAERSRDTMGARPLTAFLHLEHGRALRGLGRLTDAERAMSYAQPILVETYGAGNTRAEEATRELAEILEELGRPEDAARLRGLR